MSNDLNYHRRHFLKCAAGYTAGISAVSATEPAAAEEQESSTESVDGSAASSKFSIKLIDEGSQPAKGLLQFTMEIRNGGDYLHLFNPWKFPIRDDWKSFTFAVYDAEGAYIRPLEDGGLSKQTGIARSLWTYLRSDCYLGVPFRFGAWSLWQASKPIGPIRAPSKKYTIEVIAYDRFISTPPYDSAGRSNDARLKRWLKYYRGKSIAKSNKLEFKFK